MSKIEVNTIDKSSGSTVTVGGSGTNVVLGHSGQTVSVACGATTSGMGRTGTVDWCTTAKTSPFTAANGVGYFVNTTGGVVTVTLPSSPSAGNIIAISDYANKFATNKLTIARGGSKINGGADCSTLQTNGQSVTLVYVDATRGWKTVTDSTANVTGESPFIVATGGTVLTVGDYKTHVYTADSTFVVCGAGTPSGSKVLEYMVVAGGGGSQCGGGGAGGWRSFATTPATHPLNAPAGLTAAVQTYPVTVGAGGNGKNNPGTPAGDASNGGVSTFSSITSAGGGRVLGSGGQPGGSGGGAYNPSNGAGNGNTPPVSPPQGNGGGNSSNPGSSSAGGGGAGAAGSPANPGPRQGGVGAYVVDAFLGPTAPSYGTPGPVSAVRYFSGGGAGGANSPGFSPAAGGAGGGGAGPADSGAVPGPTTNATTNTGGGGGGAWHGMHGNGGSGIVMIRYKFQ